MRSASPAKNWRRGLLAACDPDGLPAVQGSDGGRIAGVSGGGSGGGYRKS